LPEKQDGTGESCYPVPKEKISGLDKGSFANKSRLFACAQIKAAYEKHMRD
jgi:hypothetical protein